MDSGSKASQVQAIRTIFAQGGEMGALMNTLDWAQTPLGPIEHWPQSLCTALSICLVSRFPMLLWWGPELVMLYNDAYRPILGSTKHPRSMGQRGKVCWPEIWDVIGPMLEGVLTQGQATWSNNQLLLLDRNGYVEECYFTFSYSPIYDESGAIGGIFTAVTETTGNVLGERRLRTLRELAAHSADGRTAEEACAISAQTLKTNTADLPFTLLYLLDADEKQARLVEVTGLTAKAAARQQRISVEDTESSIHWPLAEVVETGKAVQVENVQEYLGSLTDTLGISTLHAALVLPIARSGQERLYGILVAGINPQRALDEEYYGFFELVASQVATNIANARAYQEERERSEALAELDRAKTDFFSNVSHEFRTPLTLLLGPVEDALANAADLSQEQRELLQMVCRNGIRLLKLVNTLLDFSRIESGRIQAQYEPTDLAVFTAELASTFRSAIEQARMQLRIDCPPLAETIYIDREMWEKIVLNLLSNAFKFTFEGQIVVRQHLVGKQVELQVQDSGIGIAEEDIPRIFDRFHRLRTTRARTFEGSGIGLSLVQELVHLHGGTVHVSSQLGKGTTFTIALPVGSAHLPAERVSPVSTTDISPSPVQYANPYVEEALRWLPNEQKNTGTNEFLMPDTVQRRQQLLPATILLADDNADMREYVKRLLSPHYAVQDVADGVAALHVAREYMPDLVLSDVMMPGLDGFQLLRALREDVRTSSTPIILLSARAGEESALEALGAGADDYLVKPFSARELLARLETRLEMARMRSNISQQERENAIRLQQLAEAALTINSLHPLDELLTLVTEKARAIIGTHQALTLLVQDNNWKEALSAISLSEKYEEWRERSIHLAGAGIYAYVCRTNTTMRLTQEELEVHPEWIGFGTEARVHPPMHGWLAVPLRTRDGYNMGLLQLSDKYSGDFSADDEAILTQIVQMASIAIENVQLYQQTQQALIERNELLSSVSHDLKNPLGAIRGYTQLVQRSLARSTAPRDDRIELALQRINATVGKMTGFINELLDLTRLQAGQPIDISRQMVDLVTLVHQVVAEQQQTTQRQEIRLITAEKELTGSFDESRLERVFFNLLSNAIKYSPEAPWIDVHLLRIAEEGRDSVELRVQDYGIGIPTSDLPYIFEQFKRAQNVIGTIKGTGIGLASAYQIVKQHGGTIIVESTEGSGSTFIVRLPLMS